MDRHPSTLNPINFKLYTVAFTVCKSIINVKGKLTVAVVNYLTGSAFNYITTIVVPTFYSLG